MVRDGKALQEEREQLEDEGFESHETVRLQPKRNWYREDGSLVGMLPVDQYHEQRFRAKGWSLSPSPAQSGRGKHFLGFARANMGADEVVEPPAPLYIKDSDRDAGRE